MSLNPFKFLLKIFSWGFALFTSNGEDKESPKGEENRTSALTQERAKTVDEKADKTGYEVIIRIITA